MMFVELCRQRAGDFMQELLKPVFNTIFRCVFIPRFLLHSLLVSCDSARRASDDSLLSPDLFDKLRDLFINLLNSPDVRKTKTQLLVSMHALTLFTCPLQA